MDLELVCKGKEREHNDYAPNQVLAEYGRKRLSFRIAHRAENPNGNPGGRVVPLSGTNRW